MFETSEFKSRVTHIDPIPFCLYILNMTNRSYNSLKCKFFTLRGVGGELKSAPHLVKS